MSKTNFFTTIRELLKDNISLNIVLAESEGKISVSVLPKAGKLEKEATKTKLNPLVIRATAEDLDEEFFATILKPVEEAKGLIVDAKSFDEGLKKAKETLDEKKETETKKTASKTSRGSSTPSKVKPLSKHVVSQHFKIDEKLAAVIGELPLKRDDIKTALQKYIKVNKLRDAKDKKMILSNDALNPIIGEKAVSMATLLEKIMSHLTAITATEAKSILKEKGISPALQKADAPVETPKEKPKSEKQLAEEKFNEKLTGIQKLIDEKKYEEALAILQPWSKEEKDPKIFHLIMTCMNSKSTPTLDFESPKEEPVTHTPESTESSTDNPE